MHRAGADDRRVGLQRRRQVGHRAARGRPRPVIVRRGGPQVSGARVTREVGQRPRVGVPGEDVGPRVGGRLIASHCAGMSKISYGQLIADQTENWAKMVKTSGAKPD